MDGGVCPFRALPCRALRCPMLPRFGKPAGDTNDFWMEATRSFGRIIEAVPGAARQFARHQIWQDNQLPDEVLSLVDVCAAKGTSPTALVAGVQRLFSC